MQIVSIGDNLHKMSNPVFMGKNGDNLHEMSNPVFWEQLETICMKCQIQFSGKNKKNIIILSTPELA